MKDDDLRRAVTDYCEFRHLGTLLEFLRYYDASLGLALEDNQELLARVRADLDR